MADALPDIPKFCADTQLADKIRHGKMISTRDLTGSNGADGTHSAGSEIKVVDGDGDLIAILKYGEPGNRLKYRCVFPK
jgi:hypothetical protein